MCTRFSSGLAHLVLTLLAKLLSFTLKGLLRLHVPVSSLLVVDGGSKLHLDCKGLHFQAPSLRLDPDQWDKVFLAFGLPIKITKGAVEHCLFSVGLTGGVTLDIRGVDVLASTTNERHYDPQHEKTEALYMKRQAVKRLKEFENEGKQYTRFGMCNKLLAKLKWLLGFIIIIIVKQLKVVVKSVHIRVQDEITCQMMAVAGIKLSSLSFDERKAPIATAQYKYLRSSKSLSINNSYMYWSCSRDPKHSNVISYEEPEDCCLLKTSSASANVDLLRGTISILQVNVNVASEQLHFEVNRHQMRSMTQVLGRLKHLHNTRVFLKYRPTVPVKGNAKLWWRFTLQCYSHLRRTWDWLEVKEQSEKRLQYQNLYRQSLQRRKSRKIKEQLILLEDDMSLLNIMLSRCKIQKEIIDLKTGEQQDSFQQSIPFLIWSGESFVESTTFCLTEYTQENTQRTQLKVFSVSVERCCVKVNKNHQERRLNMRFSVGTVSLKGLSPQMPCESRPDLVLWDKPTSGSQRDQVLTAEVDIPVDKAMYSYIIGVHLQPSTVILHWQTVNKLAEYVALLKKSNAALKDAVKEKVKEIESEGRRRIRKFIRNKEIISLNADVNLPTLVLPGEEATNFSLSLSLGYIKCITKKQLTTYNNVYQDYKLNWSGLQLSSIPATTHANKLNDPRQLILYSSDTSFDVKYVTHTDTSNQPSRLSIDGRIPSADISVNVALIETLALFAKSHLLMLKQLQIASIYNKEEQDKSSVIGGQRANRKLKRMTSHIRSGQSPNTLLVDMHNLSSIERYMSIEEKAKQEEENLDSPFFSLKIITEKVCVQLSRDKETNTPEDVDCTSDHTYVTIAIAGISSCYVLKEHSSSTTLSVDTICITDHEHRDSDDQVLVPLKTARSFFSLEYFNADTRSPLFKTSYNYIESSSDIQLSEFTICLHLQSLNDLLGFIGNIKMPSFQNLLPVSQKQPRTMQRQKSYSKIKPFGGTKNKLNLSCVELRLLATGCEVAVCMCTDVTVSYCSDSLTGCLKCFEVTDSLLEEFNAQYSKIVQVGSTQFNFKMGQESSHSIVTSYTGNVDISEAKVIYLHKFVKTLLVYYRYLSSKYKECVSKLGGLTEHKLPALQAKPTSVYSITVSVDNPTILLPHCPIVRTTHSLDNSVTAIITMATIMISNRLKLFPFVNKHTSEQADEHFIHLNSLRIMKTGDKEIVSPMLLKIGKNYIPPAMNVILVTATSPTVNISATDIVFLTRIISSNLTEEEPLGLEHTVVASSLSTVSHRTTQICFRAQKLSLNLFDGTLTSSGPVCALTLNSTRIIIGRGGLDENNTSALFNASVHEIIGYDGNSGTTIAERRRIIYRQSGMQTSTFERPEEHPGACDPSLQLTISKDSAQLTEEFRSALATNTKTVEQSEAVNYDYQQGDASPTEPVEEAGCYGQGSRTDTDDQPAERAMSVTLNRCIIALLENPESGEVISPGMCIEFKPHRSTAPNRSLVNYTHSSAQWSLNADLADFQARLCLQGEEDRLIPLNQITPLCSIEICYMFSTAHENLVAKAQHIELHLTKEVVELLTSFYHTLKNKSVVEQDLTDGQLGRDIWVVKTISKEKLLNNEDTQINVDGGKVIDDDAVFYKEQKAHIELPELVVNFDVMCGGNSSSVMCLHSLVDLDCESWSHQLRAELSLCAEAYIYNKAVGSWEPLIEPVEDHSSTEYRPWTFQAKVWGIDEAITLFQKEGVDSPCARPSVTSTKRNHTPSGMATSMAISSDKNRYVIELNSKGSDSQSKDSTGTHRTGITSASETSINRTGTSGVDGTPATPEVHSYIMVCSSNDRLELTITPTGIATIKEYVEAISVHHKEAMDNIRNCLHDTKPPVQLQNKTASTVRIYPGPTFRDGAYGNKYTNSVLLPHRVMHRFYSFCKNSASALDSVPVKVTSPVSLKTCTISEDTDGNDNDALPIKKPFTEDFYEQQTYRGPPEVPLYFTMDDNEDDNDFEDMEYDEEGEEEEEEEEGEEDIDSGQRDRAVVEVEVVDGSFQQLMEEDTAKTTEVDFVDGPLQRRKSCVAFVEPVMNKNKTKRKTKGFWQPASLSEKHKIRVQVDSSSLSIPVPVSHPGVFSVALKHPSHDVIYVVCDVQFIRGIRKVILHSGVLVKNNLHMSIALYSPKLKLAEVLQGEVYELPLNCVIEQQSISIGLGSGGIPSSEQLNWKTMAAETAKKKSYSFLYSCHESTTDSDMFYVQATLSTLLTVCPSHKITPPPCYTITLDAPIVIQNNLPFALNITLKRQVPHEQSTPTYSLSAGEDEALYDFYPQGASTIRLQFKHNELTWDGEVVVNLGTEIHKQCEVKGYNDYSGKRTSKLFVKLQTTPYKPSVIQISAPVWVVNKAGVAVEFIFGRETPVKCAGDSTVPTVIGYKTDKLRPRNEFQVRVLGGKWSDKFIVGTAGGSVKAINLKCFKGEFLYEFSLVTHLVSNGLTHMVHLLPKYSVVNRTQVTVQCSNGSNTSAVVPPMKVEPFWPGTSHKMHIIIEGVSLKPVSLNTHYSSVLQVDGNQSLPAVTVQVQSDEVNRTVLLCIHPHADPSALLLIENYCSNLSIKFLQSLSSGSGQLRYLSPGQCMQYTWDNPMEERKLQWQAIEASDSMWFNMQLERAKQSGNERVRIVSADNENIEEVTCYWETVFENSQHVIKFWDSKDLIPVKHKSPAMWHLSCSFEGIGISLVNAVPEEVIYCSVTSTPEAWKRSRHGDTWSIIPPEDSLKLEGAWQSNEQTVTINDEIYDLDAMVIMSDKGGGLSRSFNPGVWLMWSESEQFLWRKFNLKLGKLQIDNQLKDCELPTRVVFSGKESENKLDAKDVGAPCVEFFLSVSGGGTSIREFEKVLLKIKPLLLNIELGVIVALLPFVDALKSNNIEPTKQFQQDLKKLDRSLEEILKLNSLVTARQENFIDMLQIAEISLALSYTTNGEYDVGSRWGRLVDSAMHIAPKGSCDINLKSVTVSNQTTDTKHLQRLLLGHYKNELFWQVRKIALGLDVIGNPVHLVNSIQTGAKDLINFSQHGMVEGETMTGIGLGMKSLFGHVIEGSAGVASSAASSLGSLLLATTDQQYRKKYRHLRNTTPKGFLPNIKLGSTFFMKGLFHGATDIFVKPVKGIFRRARQVGGGISLQLLGGVKGGVTGFFSGLGRGAVSALFKPTLAMVDLTRYTLEGVRSVVDVNDVLCVRQPRLIHSNKVILPYNSHEAEGLYILWHFPESLEDESYLAHEWLPSGKSADDLVLLVSTQQLVQLRKHKSKYSKEWGVPLRGVVNVQATHYEICDQSENEVKCGLLLSYLEEGRFFGKSKVHEILLKMEDSIGVDIMASKIKEARAQVLNTSDLLL